MAVHSGSVGLTEQARGGEAGSEGLSLTAADWRDRRVEVPGGGRWELGTVQAIDSVA